MSAGQRTVTYQYVGYTSMISVYELISVGIELIQVIYVTWVESQPILVTYVSGTLLAMISNFMCHRVDLFKWTRRLLVLKQDSI